MNYSQLKQYLLHDMRMSHVYQPLMLKTMLQRRDEAKALDIAREFLKYDDSQVEYYEKIVKNMPAKILAKHGIISKSGVGYKLELDGLLTVGQRGELIEICNTKITDYIAKRGEKIWKHRRVSSLPISGSVRYEILKRAGFHCELCGVSADERALEVDHIIPRNLGGEDSLENYQALCYKCNANKRDTDSTNFREWRTLFGKKESSCLFCKPDRKRMVSESDLVYVLKDSYPVTEGHVLIIPRRHVASFFDLFDSEIKSCSATIKELHTKIGNKDSTVQGFNIGVNDGESAGQTVFHCHWHLIPRRKGDMENPRGGVRHCVAGKGNY